MIKDTLYWNNVDDAEDPFEDDPVIVTHSEQAIPCPVCNGFGLHPYRTGNCPYCNGIGWIEPPFDTHLPDPDPELDSLCATTPACPDDVTTLYEGMSEQWGAWMTELLEVRK